MAGDRMVEMNGFVPEPELEAIRPAFGARLPAFVEATEGIERRIRALKVLVVGAGSVGSPIVDHLARLEIASIGVVDDGRFKPESLPTHPIELDDVGEFKATVAGARAKRLSPDTRVTTHVGRFEELDPFALLDFDAVVLATDNLAVEVEAGQRCLRLGLPLLQASVHGETLLTQIRSFANVDGQGPCPACLYGEAEWEALGEQTVYTCAGPVPGTDLEPASDAESIARRVVAPTRSVSALCALAAGLLVLELLRPLVGRAFARRDALIEHCAFSDRTVVSPLDRRASCPCEHEHWVRHVLRQPLARLTPSALVSLAGFGPSVRRTGLQMEIGDYELVEKGRCHCPVPVCLPRFHPADTGVAFCTDCMATLHPDPMHLLTRIPGKRLLPIAEKELAKVGAGGARWALVRDDSRAALLLGGEPPKARRMRHRRRS